MKGAKVKSFVKCTARFPGNGSAKFRCGRAGQNWIVVLRRTRLGFLGIFLESVSQ